MRCYLDPALSDTLSTAFNVAVNHCPSAEDLLINRQYQHEEGPTDPSFFEDRSFREATRLLEVKLELADSTILDGLRFEPPKASKSNPQHPPLFFKGSSRGSDSGTTLSVIKGCVYREGDGSVRWRFVRVRGPFPFHIQISHLAFVGVNLRQHSAVEVSVPAIGSSSLLTAVFASSSGVQIGDIGSAVGVTGIWTTTTHDQGDPVGAPPQ